MILWLVNGFYVITKPYVYICNWTLYIAFQSFLNWMEPAIDQYQRFFQFVWYFREKAAVLPSQLKFCCWTIFPYLLFESIGEIAVRDRLCLNCFVVHSSFLTQIDFFLNDYTLRLVYFNCKFFVASSLNGTQIIMNEWKCLFSVPRL